MKAVTVQPGVAGSVHFEDVPKPDESTGRFWSRRWPWAYVARTLRSPPAPVRLGAPGRERLVLGHESLGRDSTRARTPACSAVTCSSGSFAAPTRCRAPTAPSGNGTTAATGSTPSGASNRSTGSCPSDGGSSRATSPKWILRSASSGCCSSRPPWSRRRGSWSGSCEPGRSGSLRQALITGAGPIGMLAALIGVQHGLDVHVLDRVTEGAKPQLVHDVGATYGSGAIADLGFTPDIDHRVHRGGLGDHRLDPQGRRGRGDLPHGRGQRRADPANSSPADVAKEMVLQNNVIVGSVNANRRHFYRAAETLAAADRAWLGRLISRQCRPRTSPKR